MPSTSRIPRPGGSKIPAPPTPAPAAPRAVRKVSFCLPHASQPRTPARVARPAKQQRPAAASLPATTRSAASPAKQPRPAAATTPTTATTAAKQRRPAAVTAPATATTAAKQRRPAAATAPATTTAPATASRPRRAPVASADVELLLDDSAAGCWLTPEPSTPAPQPPAAPATASDDVNITTTAAAATTERCPVHLWRSRCSSRDLEVRFASDADECSWLSRDSGEEIEAFLLGSYGQLCQRFGWEA